MTNWLCISVTFLDAVFHGRDDRDETEWPPSPMRLFQALLAGARTGCRENEWSEAKTEAFRWLERLEPPTILTPESITGSAYDISVPNNDSDVPAGFWAKGKEPDDNKQPSKLRTIKKVHPTLLRDDTIHYIWQIRTVEGTHCAEILCQEARHMLALGWGIDQVVGNGRILNEAESELLPGKRWRPWTVFRPGEPALRVPISGSLADLENVYQRFVQGLDHRLSCFDTVAYLNSNTILPRSYASFELPDGVSFRQENAARIAAMLRSLACDCAKSDTHDFPGGSEVYVAGHTNSQNSTPPRFSYLPIPSIGGDYADGMIRRLLIAEPLEGNGAHARWAQQRLRGAVLTDENSNERGRLLDPWRQTSRTMFQRYTGESSTWCTVTPVVLPGYDDRSYAKAEKLLLASIGQAGLPVNALSDFSIRKAPFFSGSQHPRQYFLPNYLRGWPGWHVRLHFREPVPGPLAVGAGRHIGLGLFAQSEE